MIRNFTLLALILITTPLYTGCAAMKIVSAHFASTDHFLPLAADNRIRYESGAEQLAVLTMPHLDHAIRQVETLHYRPFQKPVVVYVCYTPQSFARLSGQSENVRGGVHPTQGLFLNPVLLSRPASIAPVLTHELSHLHLNQQQQMNFVDYPAWFNEGLATFVANGSGAEAVSSDDARLQIAAGKIFPPYQSGSRLSQDQSGSLTSMANGSHLFYRQGMMFIAYLNKRDGQRFKQFLLNLQDGEIFSNAFRRAFDGNVESLQAEFIASLNKP
ncbi:MAG: hypothetical protein WCD07_01760 [Burkholderiales bacterium]